MKTKEQIIQEAYGEYWDQVKDEPNILENGWLRHGFTHLYKIYDKFDCESNKYKWRPKSLQGIENNNEWIRIESEDDLPKVSGDYFFISKLTNRIVTSYFMDGSKVAYNKTNIVKQYSHYKPIEKPKPPIY